MSKRKHKKAKKRLTAALESDMFGPTSTGELKMCEIEDILWQTFATKQVEAIRDRQNEKLRQELKNIGAVLKELSK